MENSATSVHIGSKSAEDASNALKQKTSANFSKLRDAFRHYDTDKDGFIDVKELRLAASRAGIHLDNDELQRLMLMIDEDRNGQISSSEFMNHFGTEGGQSGTIADMKQQQPEVLDRQPPASATHGAGRLH